jgi:group I intron endonuclease
MIRVSGIYIIINTINNKTYIGKTIDIKNRRKQHLNNLRNNKYINNNQPTHLQSAWNKYVRLYGEEVFIFGIIEECDKDKLNDKEKYWINYYQSNNREYGYNKTEGGDGGNTWDKNSNKKLTSGKISLANKGKKRSEETKKNISNAVKGKKRSEETKKNISNGKKGKSHISPSIETIEKIRQSNLGKKRSEETKKNISNSKKGKNLSQEQKNKISSSMKGKNTFKRSEETKQKMSESKKNTWNNEEYRKKYSEKHRKLNDEQIKAILLEIKEGKKLQKDIAKEYNISAAAISQYKKLIN